MGLLSDLNMPASIDDLTIDDPATESSIILAAIRENCTTDEEFNDLINDAAVEMAIYGIIDDADAAMEASRRIIIKDSKAADLNRIQGKVAIALAKKAGDSLFTKYKKYRDLMLDAKGKINAKYGARAKTEAKRIMMNSKRKASNLESKSGKSINEKIDREINSQANAGKARK